MEPLGSICEWVRVVSSFGPFLSANLCNFSNFLGFSNFLNFVGHRRPHRDPRCFCLNSRHFYNSWNYLRPFATNLPLWSGFFFLLPKFGHSRKHWVTTLDDLWVTFARCFSERTSKVGAFTLKLTANFSPTTSFLFEIWPISCHFLGLVDYFLTQLSSLPGWSQSWTCCVLWQTRWHGSSECAAPTPCTTECWAFCASRVAFRGAKFACTCFWLSFWLL